MKREQVRFSDPQIELAHGAGGKASRRLVEGLFVPLLHGGDGLPVELQDVAYVHAGGVRLAMTNDSFVVKPLRFPGGSIGELAVNGTVNDLAMGGARPLALTATFIIEAGLATDELLRQTADMAEAARRAGVAVVGGDTKVVEHGKADGLYITTAGIGLADPRVHLSAARVRPGDQVLLSGPIGDHGITVMLARGELELEADLVSDTRPLWPFVAALLEAAAPGLRWLRDPTRGGVATALNELARDAQVAVVLEEEAIPVRPAVRGACEILGLNPLHIANEGQFLAVVAPEYADAALKAIRGVPGGEAAVRIGEIREAPRKAVLVQSPYGGTWMVDMLVGDPLPRIC